MCPTCGADNMKTIYSRACGVVTIRHRVCQQCHTQWLSEVRETVVPGSIVTPQRIDEVKAALASPAHNPPALSENVQPCPNLDSPAHSSTPSPSPAPPLAPSLPPPCIPPDLSPHPHPTPTHTPPETAASAAPLVLVPEAVPARRKRAATPKPEADGAFGQALGAFSAAWERRYGVAYVPSGPDRSHLGRLVAGLAAAGLTVADLAAIFANYLADNARFVADEKRHGLTWFCTGGDGLNKYRTRSTTAGFTDKEARGLSALADWAAGK